MYHLDQRDTQDYWARMSVLPQFRMYDCAPQWVPGSRNVETFCHDEVVRQYHDPHTLAGKSRIQLMVAAWEYARSAADDHDLPTMRDILALGKLVEPEQNSTI